MQVILESMMQLDELASCVTLVGYQPANYINPPKCATNVRTKQCASDSNPIYSLQPPAKNYLNVNTHRELLKESSTFM